MSDNNYHRNPSRTVCVDVRHNGRLYTADVEVSATKYGFDTAFDAAVEVADLYDVNGEELETPMFIGVLRGDQLSNTVRVNLFTLAIEEAQADLISDQLSSGI